MSWYNPLSWFGNKLENKVGLPEPKKTLKVPAPGGMPNRRVSEPSTVHGINGLLTNLGQNYKIVNRDFLVEVISIIRALAKMNPDISQAITDIVALGNTGHKIFFDKNVSTDQVDKMRNHLTNKKKEWFPAAAGMDGGINKLFAQLLISGATSAEWIPSPDLTTIQSVVLVNPDDIVFILDKSNSKYLPYQRVRTQIIRTNNQNLIKLNTNTYQYYALNGDTESPYGFPPYMSVLPRIKSQDDMHDNIDFIVETIGLIGFLEVLMEKPIEDKNENDASYEAKLDKLLTDAKARVKSGFKDGVVVGFKGDHEFKFNSAGSSGLSALLDIYKNNELQIFSAIKSDATLAGRDYNTSETQLTVIFTKILSSLKNMQNIIGCMIEFGYSLELRLAGYQFDYLSVRFNHSTLQDNYKYQQSEELKIKNVTQKMIMGMIDQNQAADELGYEVPSSPKPLVPWEVLAGGKLPVDQSLAKKARKTGKGESEKKGRKNNKPVPKNK